MISNEKLDNVINVINNNKYFYQNYMSNENIEMGITLVNELKGERIENIRYVVKKIENELEQQSPYAMVWWYSVLISIDLDKTLFMNFVKYIRNNQDYFSVNTRYFLYNQLKYIIDTNKKFVSSDVANEIKIFFNEIVNSFAEKLSFSLETIPENLRNNNISVVIVSQFLGLDNSVQKSALQKCKILSDVMKQKIIFINTTEMLSTVGEVPFYNTFYSKCIDSKKDEEFQEYEGEKFPYFQCEYPMPSIEQMEIILKQIRKIAPGYIISFDENSVFSALLNRIIPIVYEKTSLFEVECISKNNILISKLDLLKIQGEQKNQVKDSYKVTEEFKENFLELGGHNYCDFDECSLVFYPYDQGSYCVYDTETQEFKGSLSLTILENSESLPILRENCFSNITLEFDGDWMEYLEILKEALKRKIYVICSDIKKIASYFKIPELKSYMQNIKIFSDRIEYQQYFHKNTNEYLPRIVFANDKKDEYQLKKIIRNEHKYRLTEEGRDTSNVLLTIGIPTHNRGNLLLKRLEKLLKLQYDAEIEIIVAKNGFALYQNEYIEASCIQDSRYIYYGTDEELKPHLNWYNVTRFAHGKYILFVSDEDELINGALEYYLNLLMTDDEVSIIRTGTTKHYATLEKVYGKKGLDAFSKSFLGQNYFSGLIINNDDFRKANVMKYEEYSNNKFYQNYPHEFWCAELSLLYGDYALEAVLLIDEKQSVLNEEYKQYDKLGILNKNDIFDEDCGLPKYATYENRFEQFEGQLKFIDDIMKDIPNGIFIGLEKAINKLTVLLLIARTLGYKKEQYQDFIERFVDVTLRSANSMIVDETQKNLIRTLIQKNYEVLMQKN